ncbi:hypothetical protein B9G53_22850 [Pseudanabaena sp. SR411]|uniref:hypothetical protein n=1 Tax=Pseudanabaena sp. SR411 TaxID=1980935 RepID=UPI000B98EEFF|nr:hypothetical protein [Pseudanabaena sp. SR411]OYQ62312.1 hypothetical protein B9G53_22850 [Pseudanabaena sp. SR411]
MLKLKGDTGSKWYPKSIEALEEYLTQFIFPISGYEQKECRGLRKNIAYSLQHLEFMYRCSEDIHLSSVLWTQNTKTFIIVACSVIEAMFFYLLRSQGYATTTSWNSYRKLEGTEFKDTDGKKRKIDMEIFEKIDPKIYVEMSFDSMCKRVESKKLVVLGNDEFFKNLPYLRQLRNRVHVHIVKDDTDTDYKKINKKDYILARKVLFSLMTSELFPQVNEELFYYLETNETLQLTDDDLL